MKQRLLHTPEGVRDVYNEECAKKLVLQERLHKVLRLYGYRDIETPTLEYFDVFGKDKGTVPSRELYKFFDREGDTLVLRPDVTPSIARAAATLFEGEKLPVRLCYVANTFINHTSYQGRLKETTHLGAELIMDDSAQADAEIIAMVVDSLLSAGLKEFQVSVGQVDFFKSLMREAGVDGEIEEELRRLTVNKSNFGVEELLSEQDMSEGTKQLLLELPRLSGSVEVLDRAQALTDNLDALRAVGRLRDIYAILCGYGFEKYVAFDLGMLSRYQYYTGMILRAYTFGTGDAIVKGGRYDKLLGKFGKDAPAVGFVIVAEELMSAMLRQKLPILSGRSDTLVLYEEADSMAAIALAKHFRAQGMNMELMRLDGSRLLSDYREFAGRNHMGGIIRIVEGREALVADSVSGSERRVALETLFGLSADKSRERTGN